MALGWFRRMMGKRDARRALAREESEFHRALGQQSDGEDVRRRVEAERTETSVMLGCSVENPDLEIYFDPEHLIGRGHAIALGTTGSGKSRLTGAIVRPMLERFVRDPRSPRPWIIDHKGDLATHAYDTIAELSGRISETERERLLDAIVIVQPFSDEALVPLQILARDEGAQVDPETQADDIASLFGRLAGASLGIKQDALAYHLILLGITTGRTLLDLPHFLSDPGALEVAAAGCDHPQVRSFFRQGFRLQTGSVAGLQARFARLLRSPSARAMLGAETCLSFPSVLRDKILIIDLGGAPLGVEDLPRWWSGFLTLKITRAIFGRPPDEANRKVLIISDEWQEGLLGGRDAADNYERVLSMSRSKGTAWMLVSQSMAGAAKVSSTLPKMVATNTTVQMLFRASMEDARTMTHLLPVTGRRPRPAPLPWEKRPESPFLSKSEEQHQLVEEVTNLPDRTFYYWQRGVPGRARLVRSIDFCPVVPDFLPRDIARRIRVGSAAVPVSELGEPPINHDDEEHELSPEETQLGTPRRRRR